MKKPKYKYLIEISYKSGYSFRMWFDYFSVSSDEYRWTVSNSKNKVLTLGVDEIVSVVQLDSKRC